MNKTHFWSRYNSPNFTSAISWSRKFCAWSSSRGGSFDVEAILKIGKLNRARINWTHQMYCLVSSYINPPLSLDLRMHISLLEKRVRRWRTWLIDDR